MTRSDLALRLLGLPEGPILLASASPRRRELLERMGLPLRVVATDVPEGNRAAGESPRDYVLRLARAKAAAAAALPAARGAYVVVAADTIVQLDESVLEKPDDPRAAQAMLARLSGRWHVVWTGVALLRLHDERSVAGAESSRVRFADLSIEDREHYVASGEPLDKAGAYGIQGLGGMFVPEIEGDYFNVMGLPLARLRALCHELEAVR